MNPLVAAMIQLGALVQLFEPQYSVEVEPGLPNAFPYRINAQGNLCGGLFGFSRIDGQSLSFTRRSVEHAQPGFEVWPEHSFDINDHNVIVGTGASRTRTVTVFFLMDQRGIHELKLGIAALGLAYINNSSVLALNAMVKFGADVFAYRWNGLTLDRLPVRGTGAYSSAATEIAETGDICGVLKVRGSKGEVDLPVVWTVDNELVQLELPAQGIWGIPSGLHSRDFIFGTAYTGRKRVPAIWRKGRIEILPLAPGENCLEMFCRKDETPVATIERNGIETAKQWNGKRWVPLTWLVRSPHPSIRFHSVKWIASNDLLLVYGKNLGGPNHFLLRPLPKEDK